MLQKQPVKKKTHDMISDIRTTTFIGEEIDEESLVDALENVDIPEIMRPDSYKPEVVADEKMLVRDELEELNLLNESMKQIDINLPMQIFCGPYSEPLTKLTIRKLKSLCNGTQAEVFQVRLIGVKGKFVDKTRKITNNPVLADKTLK